MKFIKRSNASLALITLPTIRHKKTEHNLETLLKNNTQSTNIAEVIKLDIS